MPKKLESIIRQENNFALYQISSSPEAKIFYDSCIYTGDDPRFLVTTDDNFLFEFGRTGLIRSVSVLNEHLDQIETVLERDYQGRFHLSDKTGDDIVDKTIIYQNIEHAYDIVRSIPQTKQTEVFQGLAANAVIARFEDFANLMGPRDIIPDYGDHTIFVKLSDGCPNNCLHCPEGGGIDIYSKEKIIENMNLMRELQLKYHNDEALSLMYEGFLNSSCLLWFDILRSDTSSIEIVDLLFDTYPELNRAGAFFELGNVIKVCEKHDARGYDISPLKALAERGLNRAYVGVETANDEASSLLGKNLSYSMKKQAIELLKDAGIAVKEIVLVGAFGSGFYNKKGIFVSAYDALDDTARLVAETKPYRIEPSVFLPLKNIKLTEKFNDGTIIPKRFGSVDDEIDFLYKRIKHYENLGARNWQGQGRINNEIPIKKGYEEAVKGKQRKIA